MITRGVIMEMDERVAYVGRDGECAAAESCGELTNFLAQPALRHIGLT